jgi:hypothetical protein
MTCENTIADGFYFGFGRLLAEVAFTASVIAIAVLVMFLLALWINRRTAP